MKRICFFLLLLSMPNVSAQEAKKGEPPPRTTLPTDHPYQKQLRAFMAGLTEQDFTHRVVGPLKAVAGETDPEVQYRHFVMTKMIQPLVGTKRGYPSINAPAHLFLLPAIETPEGVKVPPVWPEPLIAFTHWKYEGNPYHDNRALKLRAFVVCTIHMLMMDDQLENHPDRGGARSDWFGNQLIIQAQPYPGFKDVLPPAVQKAYETGLRRMGQRVLEWGPQGEEPNLDITAVVGLWHVSQAVGDAAFSRECEAYGRKLLTDPAYFHPAGFFYDQHGTDMGYQGMTNFFAIWLALASDWPFAREVVEKTHRLRAHLQLPEPGGGYSSPTHFNTRTSSDIAKDQWEWGQARDYAASLATNEAVHLVAFPTDKELAGAGAARAATFNGQIAENPIGTKGPITNEEITSNLWKWRLWQSFNFPATMNPGYDYYPPGAYARRLQLEKENSPWLKSPFLRAEHFVRNFGDAFTVAKQPGYAAIVHSGPVGLPSLEDGNFKFAGPLGFGGGQLSAFWTPATGSVVLGRRGGNSWNKTFDLLPDWRTWPLHAVTGCKPDGKVFTSARIRQPDVVAEKNRVQVRGILPSQQFDQGKVLAGRLTFTRTFQLEKDHVRVATELQATGQDMVAELYETIPIYLTTAAKAPPTAIDFQVAGTWAPATEDYQDKVTAVKLTRYSGAVEIRFDQPQRVKLSPAEWSDTYLSRAKCRNLMIDLLAGQEAPAVLKGTRKVTWKIAPL